MRKALRFGLSVILIAAGAKGAFADSTGVTDKTIKIGLFGPLTGVSSAAKKNVLGAAAIYQDVNDRGGIHGRKIELVIEDDGCDGNKGIAAMKKLIFQDKVFMVHGAWCTAVALAVKPEAAKSPEVPYMVLGAAGAQITSTFQPNLYQPVATTDTAGAGMANFALSKPGAKKIAVIRHSDEWGMAYSGAGIARLKERGIEPVIITSFERGQTDATSQVLAIKQTQPDVVLAFLYPVEIAIYLREAYKYGLKVTTIGTTAASIDDTNKRIGIPAALSDVYMAFPLRGTITSPELSKFADIFKKYNPSESLDTMSFYSMDGAIAIVEALRRMGRNVTRDRMIAELNRLRNYDGGVQPGNITFTPNDHRGIKAIKLIGLVKQKETLFEKYPTVNQ